ncbi:MAG: LCP family protein [Ancrocorticia sp.]
MTNETKQKKKHGPAKVALIVLTSLLGLFLVAGLVIGLVVNNMFSSMKSFGDPFSEISDRPTRSQSAPGGGETGEQPVNFLIMGSDSRVSAGDPNAWEAGAQRTDALMLAQISGDRQSVTVMSIPRDSWVDIPGHGQAKINAAFSFGGPALTIQTVEQLTGVYIDHIAIVDFTSFTKLTDIVGGVEIKTSDGTVQLNGEQALKFVRERKNLPGGDFDRVRRQQAWVSAVLAKIATPEVLSSPSNLLSIFTSMKDYIAVDSKLGVTNAVSLANSMRGLRNITLLTAPYNGTGESEDGQSIVLLDEATLTDVSKAFQNDSIASWVEINSNKVETLNSRPVN